MCKLNKLLSILWMCLLILLLSACAKPQKQAENIQFEGRRTWVALLEMNDYIDGDLDMDFINTQRMKSALTKLGCPEEHFYIKQQQISQETAKEAVQWLLDRSKEGDTVLFYIFGHGDWIREDVRWHQWFAKSWQELDSRNRILIVDSCSSGEFIKGIKGSSAHTISLASVSSGEILWGGIEEEGLPIIGSVWNYYFTEAIETGQNDINQDGYISLEEAQMYAEGASQSYTMSKVLTVPAFLKMYHDLGEYPERQKKYPNAAMEDKAAGEFLLYKIKSTKD